MSSVHPANRTTLPDHSAPTYLTYHVKAILSIFILPLRCHFDTPQKARTPIDLLDTTTTRLHPQDAQPSLHRRRRRHRADAVRRTLPPLRHAGRRPRKHISRQPSLRRTAWTPMLCQRNRPARKPRRRRHNRAVPPRHTRPARERRKRSGLRHRHIRRILRAWPRGAPPVATRTRQRRARHRRPHLWPKLSWPRQH